MSEIDLNKEIELRDPITGRRTVRQAKDLVVMKPMSPEEYETYYNRVLRPLQEELSHPDIIIQLLNEDPVLRKVVLQCLEGTV